jgi:acylpyruvate hydrolase
MNFKQQDFNKKVIYSIDKQPIPVGTIFGIGRNYKKHISELKSKNLGKPIVFIKPTTTICQNISEIECPSFSKEVHHEIELAIIIGKTGKNIKEQAAHNYIAGAAVALDLTLRDIQSEAKNNGTPWTIAKGFDLACPISPVYKITDLDKLSNIDLFLEKNGELVQQGNTNQMIFSISYLISYISTFFTINPGDIILTGTPHGVGPIKKGDSISFWSDFSNRNNIYFS